MLFALSGLSALTSIPTQPSHAGVLSVIAGADLLTGLIAWLLPWQRWDPRVTAVLALPGFAVLGLSTWVFGGFAAGTGPFFVLLFAWLGLHQPIWILAACVPPATIAYVAPPVAVDSPAPVVSSALVLIPVAFGVGALIAAQARHLRAERDRADRVERWRAAMTATLAHDLRQPLTTMQAALKLVSSLHDDLDPARRKALLESAHAQTMRLTRLATTLLDVDASTRASCGSTYAPSLWPPRSTRQRPSCPQLRTRRRPSGLRRPGHVDRATPGRGTRRHDHVPAGRPGRSVPRLPAGPGVTRLTGE